MYNSVTIKTLDMSLPSYGSISDAKARLEAEEYDPVPDASVGRAARKNKPTKKEAGEQGGNNPMASLLPSMNKSIKKKEPKQRRPKEEEDDGPSFEGIKTMDMSLPSYGDSTASKERSGFSL
jgi:hypothetical protein